MKRRSIRQFTCEAVAEETAMQIVDAGNAAPSAMNLRPVRFILLDNVAMAELTEEIEGQWAVAVCADTRGYAHGTAFTRARRKSLRFARFLSCLREWRLPGLRL